MTARKLGKSRDWWPFTRLIITAAALGLADIFLDWRVEPRQIFALLGQMLGVLSILAMISFVLADVYYLLLFLVPLYVVGVLIDWFYGVSYWVCRAVFRFRSVLVLALGGLCGEILLFSGLAYLLQKVFP